MRVTVFLVFFMWTLDKIIRPEHASKVYESFYFFSAMGAVVFYSIGSLQMILNFLFLFGVKKRLTYGLIFFFYFISTVSSYKQYLAPYESMHLLFFAAWPMLAACYTLYVLRAEDTVCVWTSKA